MDFDQKPLTPADEQFLAAFEAGQIANQNFHHRDHLRLGDVEHFEIGPQVRRAEPGAGDPALLVEVIQFNEGDALILAVQAGREVV